MNEVWQSVDGDYGQGLLIIADHASNHVPPDIELGIDPALLKTHIAIDLGVAQLAKALEMPAILGGISRLVVDLNREQNAPHVIPIASDGHAIPGNAIGHQARAARIARFWHPYHDKIADVIDHNMPKLLVSLHSFTPMLASDPDQLRPWEVGILYNEDDRAARIAIPLLEAAGVIVGDQLPYSGKLLNATMNRHGEGRGIAYLGIEMRQDLIRDTSGVTRWTNMLGPIIRRCCERI
ncbi:MAG: N-formylglutamate amidohydrolase [Pseudomonadota bacterium]